MSLAWDLFCGCSGGSTGLIQAAQSVGSPLSELVGVNHWKKAVETYRRNHPWATVLHEDVRRVDPRAVIGRKKVKIGIGGPSCVYHSNARGGKPVDDQERSHAWDVIRWARLTEPENILIENVPEFANWGPLIQKTDENGELVWVTKKDKASGEIVFALDAKGQQIPFMIPDPVRKGEYFRDWIKALRALGYNVEYRVLCAAHYGDATTRRRLFIQARRNRITWPEASYRLPDEALDIFNADLPFARSAREIIDWNLKGNSIFNRKKPLADATMRRILKGLEQFAGCPFIVPQLRDARVRSVDEPMNTIMSTGTGNALIEPFIITIDNQSSAGNATSIEGPITTVVGKARHALIEPFLIGIGGPRGRQVVASLDEPLATVIGQNHTYLCEPFLVSYYGTGGAHEVSDPLNTITSKERFALIEAYGQAMENGVAVVADIRLRMLRGYELAGAHTFPEGFEFVGSNKDAVKMVGNSIPVKTAEAILTEMLA